MLKAAKNRGFCLLTSPLFFKLAYLVNWKISP